MDTLRAMRVFHAVASLGGFSAAARHLHTSAPSVTRMVAALEDSLGVSLFARSTRTVRLTDAGERYLAHVARILEDIADAEAEATGAHGEPQGLLRVTAPVLFGQYHVLPIARAYLGQYPGTTIETLFVDRLVNLVEEGIDAGIRIGELPDSSLMAAKVGSVRRVVCAAPGYLQAHGTPKTPDELAGHTIVSATHGGRADVWSFGEDRRTRVNLEPRLYCNSNAAAIEAAASGFGLTRVLAYQAWPDIEAGRLSIVLQNWEGPPAPVHVVHAQSRRMPMRARVFIDLAVDTLRANPSLRGS